MKRTALKSSDGLVPEQAVRANSPIKFLKIQGTEHMSNKKNMDPWREEEEKEEEEEEKEREGTRSHEEGYVV